MCLCVCYSISSRGYYYCYVEQVETRKDQEKRAIDATAALIAEQWAKVVTIERNSGDDNSVS